MALLVWPAGAEGAVIDLENRRELFVDHYLIEKLDGATLQLHTPRRAGTVIQFDRPWEGIASGCPTILHDQGKYRLYYRGWPQREGALHNEDAVTCYAESADGKRFTRPHLGIYEIHGTRDNNVILADVDPGTVTHNFVPFIDGRPGTPASERYKGVGGLGNTGLIAFVSADAIHWKKWRDEPIITQGAFDSQNIVFWSEHEQAYVSFFRRFINGVRWITRSTSKDFAHWSEPVNMSMGDSPAEHLYTNQTSPYFRAPHIYIGTAARFWPGRWALRPELEREIKLSDPDNYGSGRHLRGGLSDGVLITSRANNRYDRTFMESQVRMGGDPRDWVARSNFPALGVVPTGTSEMSIYMHRHYGQPSIYLERLTLRTDGFASVHAPYGGGEMLTKPLTFSGRRLEINYATSAAGMIRVEIQDRDGKPLPGFALEECPEIIGDQIERVVAWKSSKEVTALAGQTVRLRFQLKDADLFSLRFR